MLKPYDLVRKPRLRAALREYPLFCPPHKARESELSRENAFENYEFFLSARKERLKFMRSWLLQHFSVQADLSESGLASFSSWLDKYAMYFIDPFGDFKSAYDSYNPRWIGQYSSLNLIFDTAIYYGEYVISIFPFLDWAFLDALPLVPGQQNESYQRPTIFGFSGEWKTDPIKISFSLYRDACAERGLFRKDSKGRLLRWVELAAYGARHYPPSGDGPPSALHRFNT